MSPGCDNCYAREVALWLKRMGMLKYADGFTPRLWEDALDEPLGWKQPSKVFAVSMGDLFHSTVPPEYIQKVFDVMTKAHWHEFIVLTKRSKRALSLAGDILWPENLWMGVSIENNDYVHRADDLRKIPAAARVLSLEPLLGPVPDLNLDGVDWVVVGGESGKDARPMDPAWVRGVRDKCVAAGIAFFFKQWGGTKAKKKKAGRILDGRTWDQYPVGAGALS